MALVQGEDSESDEEINTDQLTEGSLGYASGSSFPSLQSDRHKTGIVAGEESETDEEDEGTASLDQTDSGVRAQPTSSRTSSVSPRDSPRRSSLDSTTSAPPSYVMTIKFQLPDLISSDVILCFFTYNSQVIAQKTE